MKSLKMCFAALCALLFFASGFAAAADKNYKKGSVWSVGMISTEAGQSDTYLDSLKASYTTVMEEAKRQGLVLSYKILVGDRANPQDWDVMILIEYPNWSSFDTAQEKFDAITAKYYGSMEKSDDHTKKEMADRVKIRTIFGGKQMQEIQFVK
jgi:hypothetical protein